MALCLAVSAALTWSLSGCGQRVTQETETEKKQTEAPVVVMTEAVTEKQEVQTETETQKLITSVDYTSKDSTVKITLPDNTWKVTQDADEMRVFQSGNAAIINIVHASTETAMKNLSVQTSEEDLKASLSQQYANENDYSVESFNTAAVGNIHIYRYVIKYNAQARMWAYSMTNAIVADNEAYVVTGTVTDDNATLLVAVQKAVESFRVLSDEDFKAATGEVLSGKTQKTSETVNTNTASAAELQSLKDYGTTATLVTNDVVNVRLAPGTDADILSTLVGDVKVTVTGETSNWFQVSINGNTGYIRKDFLVYGTTSTSASEAADDAGDTSGAATGELNTATNYGSSTTLYASSAANVRSQPGTDSAVIDGLSTGASVTVVGETDNWFIVNVDGYTGYVSKALLTSDSSIASGNVGTDSQNYNNGDGTTNTDSGNSNTSNGGTNTASSASSVNGTVVGASVDTLTIAGSDGNTYYVYYGDAAVTSSDGLYEGVNVNVSLDASQASSDGTLYATSVSGN